ncbi:MAG: hypothetical protein IH606_18195 [Burkholderiales bacterium]|nr:hypothetical protein [Burkholderiales bacterium]
MIATITVLTAISAAPRATAALALAADDTRGVSARLAPGLVVRRYCGVRWRPA